MTQDYRFQSSALFRGTVVSADDKTKLQGLRVRGRFGESFTAVEHFQPYGFSAVPLPPTSEQDPKTAEVVMANINGDPAHPVIIAAADRRHRPTNRKPGDVTMHDHRKQSVSMGEKGTTHATPMDLTHTITDKDGKVLSSVTQHAGGDKITMTTKGGATVVMEGANITHKPGAGGKMHFDGDVNVKGSVNASETVAAGSVTSGGSPVQTA